MDRAAIYIRISKDRDGQRAGVRRQLEDCQSWAAERGVTVVETFEDNDISAYSGKTRPAYVRMCDELKNGRFDGIIVWHLDRLIRRPLELEHLVNLVEATGAKVATVTGGDYDLSTSDGRMMARVVGAAASKESEDKSRRIRRQAQQQAEEGRHSGGGTRAYGYTRDYQKLVKTEAAIITEAANRILAGDSLRGICTDLTDRGVKTVTGTPWTTTVLKGILTSGRISGQRDFHGESIAKGDWPAIITPQTTARLRAKLQDSSRPRTRAARSYPLKGLLVCSKCGSTMVSRPRADKVRQYACISGVNFGGCGGTKVLAEPVEEVVAEDVLIRLNSPAVHREMAGRADKAEDADALASAIAEDRDQLDDLAAIYAAKEISAREWLTAKAPIQQRIDTAERTLAALTDSAAVIGHIGNAATLRKTWGSLTADRQRSIITVLVDHVVVNPVPRRGSNKFAASRVDIVWKN